MAKPLLQPSERTLRQKTAFNGFLIASALLVFAVFVWQGITAQGNPDPSAADLSVTTAVVNTGILVFREGLEAILVLAAITASMVRKQQAYWKPVALGSGLSLLATLATWFLVVALISVIPLSELDIQAATGLLAIVVLLIIMNWFFHKLYWTGWISHHNRRKQALTGAEGTKEGTTKGVYSGLLLLGFTAVYREGFEVVLFLQNLRLRAGGAAILQGVAIGLFLTAIVAVLTFVLHHHLPYKKMLVLTGVMLGAVLIVMVGESVQELQLAHWLPTTELGVHFPAWWGMWFAVFPNLEGVTSQLAAALLVVGSYVSAQYLKVWRPRLKRRAANQLA